MNAIVFSVWKCRGLWYSMAWALDAGIVVESPKAEGGYAGKKTEAAALEKAARMVEQLRAFAPECAELPAVRENSPEWEALRK